jgi:hypothetical protein
VRPDGPEPVPPETEAAVRGTAVAPEPPGPGTSERDGLDGTATQSAASGAAGDTIEADAWPIRLSGCPGAGDRSPAGRAALSLPDCHVATAEPAGIGIAVAAAYSAGLGAPASAAEVEAPEASAPEPAATGE